MHKNIFVYLAAFALIFVSFNASALELARIGKRVITDSDVKDKLKGLPPVQKNFLNRDAKARERLVDNVVMEELFVQEAQASKIQNSAEFKERMEQQRRQLLAQQFVRQEVESKLSAKAIQRFFNQNKIRYRTDEVRAFHILVKTEAEAKEVYEKAKKAKNDAEFQALAKQFSTDPSVKQNLGDLGFFTRSRMVPEFAEAAFKMKKGEISQPVKTAFGYHIIKLVEKKAGAEAKFDAVQAKAKNDLRSKIMEDLVAGLRKKRNVTTNSANIQKLKF